MRVLLDENLPHDLAGALAGHAVSTVQSLGWAGTRNGALLKRAGTVCDVFISMGGNVEHQQNLAGLAELAFPICVSWNQLYMWLRTVDGLRTAA